MAVSSETLVQVTTGVLPLAANAHGRSGDVERAAFLASTLHDRWRDETPFRLIVVTPARDTAAVAAALESTPHVRIEHWTEEAFFGERDAFHGLPGWWKQQIIKLVVPAVLRVGPYLTFDADVACLRDIDGRTFVRDGRLMSQWYRQHRNGWWAATTRLLGQSYHPTASGFDVTPNVLHSDLSAHVIWRLAASWLGLRGVAMTAVPGVIRRAATARLRHWYEEAQTRARAGQAIHEDTWTEYALYTLLSGDKLLQWHVKPTDDMPLLAHDLSVWFPDERERLCLYTPSMRPSAPFAVLQSTSGVSLAEVKAAVGRLPRDKKHA
ncbi:MAG: DUF6492 family protein [Reyranella sp.]|uniref:DUF6492 family protein n=1 Tax=Reyranella sp. TaxID=1929291 RepID=UPI003D1426C9